MTTIRLIPTIQTGDIEDILNEVLNKVTYRFWCCSPFVMANGLNVIKRYLKAGIDFRLISRLNEEDILNGLIDPRAIAGFIEAGGKARFHDRSLHAKIWIADDDVFVGSANLTGAGLNDNVEFMAAVSNYESLQVSPDEWFSTIWSRLRTTEKSPADLRSMYDSLAVSTAHERIRTIARMRELKDFGVSSMQDTARIITSNATGTGWFKVNGESSHDRIQSDYDMRDLLIYEGAQTVSKKGRPKWQTGEKVILSYLATTDGGFNDYCIYGRGIVDIAHRQGVDEIPNWLRKGQDISDRDYEHISRWPYIVWLRDIQIINGKARDALWLSRINLQHEQPVISPNSLTRKSYIKLGVEKLAIFDSLLDHLFASASKPLYLGNPQQVWWNGYITDKSRYVTRARLDAEIP